MAVADPVDDLSGNAEAQATQSLSYWQLVRRRFFRNTYGVAGLFLCLFIIITAIFSGFIAPYSTTRTDSAALYQPPQGTRVTLLMGVVVMLAAGLIGTIVGVSSGYFGGLYDLTVQRIVEFVKAFPDLPLYLALVALLPRRADPELIFFMFAGILVLLRWADLSRELRGKVIAMRGLDYVRSAEAVGASSGRILSRHVLPNVMSHIIVWASFSLPEIILLESFLSFLGVGVQAPMVSWGSMLNQVLDFQSFSAAPWMMAPVGMIIISVLAFNAFGDGLRDAMDPYSDA